eukprot:TCALIF_06618-PB protein Name:"Protein of unknown function" AED:0.44 eAED:0.44 QI:74/1/1/1/0/0.5/2/513/82
MGFPRIIVVMSALHVDLLDQQDVVLSPEWGTVPRMSSLLNLVGPILMPQQSTTKEYSDEPQSLQTPPPNQPQTIRMMGGLSS